MSLMNICIGDLFKVTAQIKRLCLPIMKDGDEFLQLGKDNMSRVLAKCGALGGLVKGTDPLMSFLTPKDLGKMMIASCTLRPRGSYRSVANATIEDHNGANSNGCNLGV